MCNSISDHDHHHEPHCHEHGHEHGHASTPDCESHPAVKQGDGKGKILFFDTVGGISGDMTISALLDLGVPLSVVHDAVERLGLRGMHIHEGRRFRSGISCASFDVHVEPHQPQRCYSDIKNMIEDSSLEPAIKTLALEIFLVLGRAEAHVHHSSLEHVHFHEVGAVDSIVDIVGTSAMIHYLAPSEIVFSPVPMGYGYIRAAHGVLPVPAPATLRCLHGVPTYGVDVASELVTPTGAAIARVLADRFARWPSMVPLQSGFGSGSKDLPELPNLLRVVLGDALESSCVFAPTTHEIIETNVDDMTGELMGHVIEELMHAGALDVWVLPTTTKKGRPGLQLSVLAEQRTAEALKLLVLSETTSIGLRCHGVSRVVRSRHVERVETQYGTINVKVSHGTSPTEQVKPEFGDCQRAAAAASVPVREVIADAVQAYRNAVRHPQNT